MKIRLERLREMIREEAAELITSHLNDPRIGFCTVTGVELAPDLSHATLHVSVLGTEAQKRTTLRGLQDARGLIQRRIASRMKTRTTPHVEIRLDESIERAFRIMEAIKAARASDPDHGRDPLPPVNPPGLVPETEEPPAREPAAGADEKPKRN